MYDKFKQDLVAALDANNGEIDHLQAAELVDVRHRQKIVVWLRQAELDGVSHNVISAKMSGNTTFKIRTGVNPKKVKAQPTPVNPSGGDA